MKFNYAFRKREFDREWDRIEKLCLAEGISAEAIAEARKESWEEVKSDRKYASHTVDGVDYESIVIDPASDYSSGGTRIAVGYDYYDGHSRYWWIENPANSALADAVVSLTDYDKELLTLRFKEKYTLEEMEFLLHVPSVTLWRRLERLCALLRIEIGRNC